MTKRLQCNFLGCRAQAKPQAGAHTRPSPETSGGHIPTPGGEGAQSSAPSTFGAFLAVTPARSDQPPPPVPPAGESQVKKAPAVQVLLPPA